MVLPSPLRRAPSQPGRMKFSPCAPLPQMSDLCIFRVNPSHLELKGSDKAQSILKL
jgi:hypothetical protein